MSKIDRHSDVPIWLQIKLLFVKNIKDNIWKPGIIIPNERTLVDIYQASTGTIRKAVSELEKEGILKRRQGIGTFVATHDEKSFLYKYFHITPKDKNVISFPKIELMSFEVRKIKSQEANLLKIDNKSSKVFHIINRLSINNNKCMIDDIVISCNNFPLLTQEIFVNRHGTIYNLYQDRFGIFITGITERITAINTTKELAQFIKIKENQAIMKISRISYTFDKKPIEIRNSFVNTQNFEYYSQDFAYV